MKEAGIIRIWTSILRRQNTVTQFIATRPILDLCKKANRQPSTWLARWWCEKTGIDWEGAQERVEAAKEAEPGTKEFMDLESEADNKMDGTVGSTGEEASLGTSWSSGADWSGVEQSGAE